ncbi:MAG: NAD(P)-dependent oxidoreductase [Paludibaculum sp.]
MKIFVAGASGAVGQPLVTHLVRLGHTVSGLTQTEAGRQRIQALGAAPALVSAFDAVGVEAALRESGAEIVIDLLTALPATPMDLNAALPGDRKLRIEGGGNLRRAAQACGVRRYLQQSGGMFLRAGAGLADESVPMAVDASPGVSFCAKLYEELETRAVASAWTENVILRYGFLYGPDTWYYPGGGTAEMMHQGQFPIVGEGNAVWSFVHVEDAALATIAAMAAPPGVYHIVDSNPAPSHTWLPRFAKWVGAPPPARVNEDFARGLAGEDAVYYGNRLRGASNEKARRILRFQPRPTPWLEETEP